MSEQPDSPSRINLTDTRVAILGLGLMGGSLAMALRGHCERIVAADNDFNTLALAREMGIVDEVARDPGEILPQASLVILAVPIQAMITILGDLPRLHPGRPVVLDLGSTKVEILRAMAGLPDRFDPLGGHPMCGKETSGLIHASTDMYTGAAFALTPLERTTPKAKALGEQLARAVGAHPLWMEAESHDRWVAATSHVPYLLATALSLATPAEAAPLIGPGFRSTTRLASSSTTMMMDILATNRQPVLLALRQVRAILDQIENHLTQADQATLTNVLTQARMAHQTLTTKSDGGA